MWPIGHIPKPEPLTRGRPEDTKAQSTEPRLVAIDQAKSWLDNVCPYLSELSMIGTGRFLDPSRKSTSFRQVHTPILALQICP